MDPHEASQVEIVVFLLMVDHVLRLLRVLAADIIKSQTFYPKRFAINILFAGTSEHSLASEVSKRPQQPPSYRLQLLRLGLAGQMGSSKLSGSWHYLNSSVNQQLWFHVHNLQRQES